MFHVICTRLSSAQGACWGGEALPRHDFLLPPDLFSPSSFCQGDPTAGCFRVLDEDNSFVLNEPQTPGEVCSQLFKGQDSVEPGTRVCQLHQQALQPSPQQAKRLQLLKPSSAPKAQLSGDFSWKLRVLMKPCGWRCWGVRILPVGTSEGAQHHCPVPRLCTALELLLSCCGSGNNQALQLK